MAGSNPNVTMSANESSCFPISLVALSSRAVRSIKEIEKCGNKQEIDRPMPLSFKGEDNAHCPTGKVQQGKQVRDVLFHQDELLFSML